MKICSVVHGMFDRPEPWRETFADLRDAALSMRAGGVGYYAASNFVHIDTGRVRRW